jgi:hypothetical protein
LGDGDRIGRRKRFFQPLLELVLKRPVPHRCRCHPSTADPGLGALRLRLRGLLCSTGHWQPS